MNKYVVVVGPHTSWKDFLVGSFARKCVGAEFINFVGKRQLFDSAFGWYFRWMGGHPVDRSKHTKLVDQIVELFRKNERFALTLTPEGTRKRVNKLKTGYYFVARAANVPIVLVGFDFSSKTVSISAPREPLDTIDQDLLSLAKHYENIRGAHPDKDMSHLYSLLKDSNHELRDS